jgi:hypothetical protein
VIEAKRLPLLHEVVPSASVVAVLANPSNADIALQLKTLQTLRDLDFRDEDLTGFDFSEADLSGSDFRRAKVAVACFEDADLTGAIGLPEGLLEPPPEFSIDGATPLIVHGKALKPEWLPFLRKLEIEFFKRLIDAD